MREHAFTDVDAQSDPEAWVRVLDTVRQEPLNAAYKQRTVELLDPQTGGCYLEVGTGTGDDALAFAARFSTSIVGVDSSSVMVEEARRRGLMDAVAADAHALPFEADRFDGAWADRTFQHLADPAAALGEMVRVVKPGGRIVVADPDYGTQGAAVADQELARRVLRFRAEFALRNDTLAHQMARLFAQAGLTDVRVEMVPIVLHDPTALRQRTRLAGLGRFCSRTRTDRRPRCPCVGGRARRGRRQRLLSLLVLSVHHRRS